MMKKDPDAFRTPKHVRVTLSEVAARGSSVVTERCWCHSGTSGGPSAQAGSGRNHCQLSLLYTGRQQSLEPVVPVKKWLELLSTDHTCGQQHNQVNMFDSYHLSLTIIFC